MSKLFQTQLIRIKRYIEEYLLAFVAFLVAILTTLVLFSQLKKWSFEKSQDLFEVQTSQATERVSSRMTDYIQILKAGKGLYASQDTITREEWESFYRSVDVEKNYPGIQGIGYAVYLSDSMEGRKLQQKVKNEGVGWFKIFPDGTRDAYTPIIFIEPFDWRNQRALGYDMFSNKARRKAMEEARDNNLPILSGIVTLVQETDQDIQNGFLLYLPVYKNKSEPVEIDQRRKLLKGFIYSPFRARDLFSSIFRNSFPELYITVKGIDENGESRVLYSDIRPETERSSDRISKSTYLNIAGQTWKISYETNPLFGSYSDKIQPYLVLLAGTVISILIFFIFWLFLKTRRANIILNTVTSNATAGLFMVNSRGYCTFVNQSGEDLLGFKWEEIKDTRLEKIVYRKSVNRKGRENRPFQGSSRQSFEDIFFRKDGTPLNVSISSRPVFEGAEPVSTIIEVRDISEEKQSAEKIRSINEDLSRKNDELNRINADLDNFIYTASHDLKAPVSNIEGLVNALEEVQGEEKIEDSQANEIVNLIKKSILRFKNTIQDLTDITKIQKNFESYQELVDIQLIVNEVLEDLTLPLKESEGKVVQDLRVKTVYFSKPNLKSIIYNLLSNAIKYRSPERKLLCYIRFYEKSGKLILEVQDNGLGIRKNLQEKVFGMFKRVHSHVEGSGIGLYIVKRMVENAGGRIKLESEEGTGSKFVIILNKKVF